MGYIRRAERRIEGSESLRVAVLMCLTTVLAVAFLLLLVADQVQASGI